MHDAITAFLTKTPFALWLIAVGVALGLETVYAGEKRQPLRKKLLNLTSGVITCLSVFLILPLARMITYAAAGAHGIGLIDLRLFPHFALASQITAGLMLLFLDDLLFYAWHRTEHTVSVLWEIHAVHHSDTALNTTTYLRQHWLEVPLQKMVFGVPLVLLFKFTPIEAAVVAVGGTFFVFFSHMNVRWQMGRWSWIVTGPQLHRLHHSTLPQHQNMNYAQIFPVIDRIFGTYVAPERGEFPPTGLASREPIETMRETLLWPFRKWARAGLSLPKE